MIRRAYADTPLAGGTIQTHYRAAGAGAALLLLHPSPLSSAFMAPLMEELAGAGRLVAPDTPGYGASDPLPGRPPDLAPYTDWLAAFLDALGLRAAGIYGSATGAQIAIEFARRHPERTCFLVLDNAVHFGDQEREAMLERYFPDLAPRADGSHLALAWHMADALFRRFPWYLEEGHPDADPAPGGAEPPVALVHATAMGYLQAGAEYALAYRAAFRNERAERLAGVPVPVTVIRWQGSILRRYAERLDGFDWPDHIRMAPCGPSTEERWAAIRAAVTAHQAATA